MSFLAPFLGIGAFGVGASVVILVYMLRLRRRPLRVSSTLLWTRAADEMEGNVPWRAAKPGLLMLLQLLGVALLAAAIARPVLDQDGAGGGVSSGALTVVIDTGASMGAVVDASGATRLDRAKSIARDLVRSGGSDGATLRVIRAGSSASLVHGGASWREAVRMIDTLEVEDTSSDLDAAMMLAVQDREDADDATVVVLSDTAGASNTAGAIVRRVDPFTADRDWVPIRNVGVTTLGAQRDAADASLVRFFVRLEGRSDDDIGAVLRLSIGGEEIAARALDLIPDDGGSLVRDVSLDARVAKGGLVRVRVDVRDALGADNDAWIELPAPDPVRTLVVAPGGIADPLLLDALRAITRADVGVTDPGSLGELGMYDWVVFDRVVPEGDVLIPSLVIAADERGVDGTTRRLVTWDRSDPLMRDLELSGLVFTGRSVAGNAADVAARTREEAVVWRTARSGVRHVRVGFALEDSNFGVLVSFPIFIANTLETLVPGVRGSGVTRRVGDRVSVNADPEALVTRAPTESARLGPRSDGARTLLGASRAGVYEIGDDSVALSVLDRGVSRRAGSAQGAADQGDVLTGSGSVRSGREELWRVLALAALVVLSLEWVLDVLRRRV